MNFVVMRSTEAQEEADGGGEGRSGRGARRVPEQQYFRRHSTFLKVNADTGRELPRVSLGSTPLWFSYQLEVKQESDFRDCK